MNVDEFVKEVNLRTSNNKMISDIAFPLPERVCKSIRLSLEGIRKGIPKWSQQDS